MRKSLLRIAVSVFFLGLLFYSVRGDLPRIVDTLKNAHKGLLLASTLIFLSTVILLAKRLQLIFAAEDVEVRFTDCSNLTFVGYFFNNFLPTSVGGDIVKAMCAARVTREPVKSITSVIMDRVFGLFTFILIPSLSVAFLHGLNPQVPVIVYSFLAFSVVFFFMLFNRDVARRFRFVEKLLNRFGGIGGKIRQLYDGMHNFKNHRLLIGQAMFLSIVGQSVSIFVLYLMARALGADTSPIYFFLLVPIVHLISMAPSLNGLGIRENAYIYFLKPYIGTSNAAAISFLWLGLLFLMSLIGGLIYLFRHDYHIQFKQAKLS